MTVRAVAVRSPIRPVDVVTAGDPAHARAVLRAHGELRAALGLASGFDEAFGILLFLFAEAGEAGVPTASCCAAVPAPRTTALRWIKGLVEAGLVVQSPAAGDRRVTLLRLSARVEQAIRQWLIAVGTGAGVDRA